MAHQGIVYEYLKEYRFIVEINGFPVACVEEFDPWDRTIEVVETNGAGQNHPYKEAGGMKYENAKLRNVVPTDGPGKLFWENAMSRAQNPASNAGLAPPDYMFNFTLIEIDNQRNPIRATEFYHALVRTYKMGNRNALSFDKNVIEEVEIAYTDRETRSL